MAAKLSSCTLPVMRKAREVVQPPIPLFTSENMLHCSHPHPRGCGCVRARIT